MRKINKWPRMIFFLSFLLGCNPTKGTHEARQKVNKEVKMILESLDGYAQKAEVAARRAERACFRFMREFFQKAGAAGQDALGGPIKDKLIKEENGNEKDFDSPFNNGGFAKEENNGG